MSTTTTARVECTILEYALTVALATTMHELCKQAAFSPFEAIVLVRDRAWSLDSVKATACSW